MKKNASDKNLMPTNQVQKIIDDAIIFWGIRLRYVHKIGYVIFGLDKAPFFLKDKLKEHQKSIDNYIQLLNHKELIYRAYNIYFYLLEVKRQKLKILGKPLDSATITEKYWCNAVSKIMEKSKYETIEILNILCKKKNLHRYDRNGHKCIKSDVEQRGRKLNLRDDYYISFDHWLGTPSVKTIQVKSLNSRFPNKDYEI